MTSRLAFAAQYAVLLPCPVKPEIDETLATAASPDARSRDVKARITAKVPYAGSPDAAAAPC